MDCLQSCLLNSHFYFFAKIESIAINIFHYNKILIKSKTNLMSPSFLHVKHSNSLINF